MPTEPVTTGPGRAIALAAITTMLLIAAWQASDILFLLFGSVLFAVVLSGAANGLGKRTGIQRGVALAIVVTSLAVAAILAGVIVAPRVIHEMRNLAAALPKAFSQAAGALNATDWGAQVMNEVENWPKLAHSGGTWGKVTGAFVGTFGAVGSMLFMLLLAVYLAAQPGLYISGLLRLFAPSQRARLAALFHEIEETLRRWFAAKLLLMGFVAVATSLALFLLGVPLAMSLGLIAGLLDFIPNFGPLIAILPAALIAFAHHPMDALWVTLIYFAIQMCENQLLTPLVQQRAVDLPPALTLISQATLGVLFGLQGVLFASPIAAAALVAVKTLYVEEYLERRDPVGSIL